MPPDPLDPIHAPVENFEKYYISQEEAALGMGSVVLNALLPVVSSIPHWKMTSVWTVYAETC